jgi:hypothetical protein
MISQRVVVVVHKSSQNDFLHDFHLLATRRDSFKTNTHHLGPTKLWENEQELEIRALFY